MTRSTYLHAATNSTTARTQEGKKRAVYFEKPASLSSELLTENRCLNDRIPLQKPTGFTSLSK